jgi:hypothetical protein
MKLTKKIIGLLADKMQEKTGLSRGYILKRMTTRHIMHGDTAFICAHLSAGAGELKKDNNGNNIEVSISENEL